MQTQKILCIVIMLIVASTISAQNVGIGTENPTQLLSVAGSIVVDHDNANTETPDSPSLLFGTGPLKPAIFSSNLPGTSSTNGLDFWTNGERRMIITEEGTVGINLQNPDLNYALHVAGSIRTSYFNSNNGTFTANLTVNGVTNVGNSVNINGPVFGSNKLTVNNGNSYFGGNGQFTGYLNIDSYLDVDGDLDVGGDVYVTDNIVSTAEVSGANLRATQHMSVGGAIDPTYRLRVWDGNSRFGGDAQVTGMLNAGDITTDDITANDMTVDDITADALTINTINGKGVVRSNGNSSLRVGFSSQSFEYELWEWAVFDLTVPITAFEGGTDDVRVFICQFAPDPLPQYAEWDRCTFQVHSVNSDNDTCKVRIRNTTNTDFDIKGTLYVAAVAKD